MLKHQTLLIVPYLQLLMKRGEALPEAVDLYLNGKWKNGEDSSNDSDTGDDEEEIPDIDSDVDWMDED